MRGFLRVVVMAMLLSMASGLVAPSVATMAAQGENVQPVGMVSGAWRMMAWQFAFAPAFPDQGLEARDGSNWGILIADMTNTGPAGGMSVADVKLGNSEVSGDVAKSVEISRALGFSTIADGGVFQVAENGIARIVVVMDVPEGVGHPAIKIGDQIASIEPVMTGILDLTELPEATTSMQLERVSPSRYYLPFDKFGVDLPDGTVRDIPIAGISAPGDKSCHGRLAVDRARLLAADGVWIETIPGINAPTLWVNNPDEYSFVLLGAELVESGVVRVQQSGSGVPSVYSGWLMEVQETAKSGKVGVWGDCPANSEAMTNLDASIGMSRAEFTPVDPIALFSSPQSYMGAKVTITGVVDGIAYEDGMTTMILYNSDYGALAIFGIGYQGALPGVSDGQAVSVYGVVSQVITAPNNSGVLIRVPLIFATIVE